MSSTGSFGASGAKSSPFVVPRITASFPSAGASSSPSQISTRGGSSGLSGPHPRIKAAAAAIAPAAQTDAKRIRASSSGLRGVEDLLRVAGRRDLLPDLLDAPVRPDKERLARRVFA